jgi:integrase
MRKTLTLDVVAKLKPRRTSYDVMDAKQPGLSLRVRPSGHKGYLVRLRNPEGRWYWWGLGPSDGLTPEAARDAASNARGQSSKAKLGLATDPRAERAEREQEAEAKMTLRTFVTDKYGPWVQTNRKTGGDTVQILEGRCQAFLDLPLREIVPFTVERWRSAYLKRGKTPATVNRVLQALKACLSKAVEWNIIDKHPLKGLKLARVDTVGRLRYLTPDEESRLLDALKARDDKRRDAREHHNQWCRERHLPEWPTCGTYTDLLTPLVTTLLHTGLRFGEACGLTWRDVDLTGALLTVRGETSKTNTTRYVPLNTTVTDVLKVWRPTPVSLDAYVFPGKDADRLVDIKTAWAKLLKDVKDAPIAGFRLHDLRHTFASKLVQAGVDLNTVRELLGHADIKMTLRYAHLAPEHRAAAVARLVNG